MSQHRPFWKNWIVRGQEKTSPYWDRLMDWAAARDLQEHLDFATDADWAILEQNPGRPRVFVWTVTGFFLVALLWAAFAQIDEVTKGEGKVVASSQNQHIQSLDGGVVSRILVHEGQVVQKGQLLLNIDNTRFVSSLQASQAQYLALLGKAARLRAIAEGSPLNMPAQVTQEAPDIAKQESDLYRARQQELEDTVQIAHQELNQRTQELSEMRARRQQADQSYQLTARELEQTRPLLDSGAVSQVDLLRLQRDVSRFKGDRDMAEAQIARLQAAIIEANRKVRETELSFRNQASAELSETMAKINSLSADTTGLANKVKLSELRSPVRGEVKQIYANTVGGVVQPGKDVMEIVPIGDSLLVETRVSPRDIAFLRTGQDAKVKFTAYDYTIYGGMDGVVQDVGADTETDEHGNSFYIVKVRTRQSSLGDKHLPIIPGMVAQVDIMTGKKSILSYMLKPVLRAKTEALSER
ncbi:MULTISPECIES: HlyD family type I secretion periplasmic adaptor subunit [unclassified Paludibacterium]|uniref:HlyD family type I secretion periplasmic adaptor subunit n=1 Tax=unclassified Paludibacterium TaxID=2618429 RepID=UPI001C044ADF|nr:HlyD family type I secretion periplasmic adaptor subunit [Paludibacterium sp. B53371]BEV73774.1 HlyD family type I secretion periplasmic adaptor subunit [Paludibacterium sp. THUN1379]